MFANRQKVGFQYFCIQYEESSQQNCKLRGFGQSLYCRLEQNNLELV